MHKTQVELQNSAVQKKAMLNTKAAKGIEKCCLFLLY